MHHISVTWIQQIKPLAELLQTLLDNRGFQKATACEICNERGTGNGTGHQQQRQKVTLMHQSPTVQLGNYLYLFIG